MILIQEQFRMTETINDNLTRQAEEIEALCSIYEDNFKTESESARIYTVTVKENNIEVFFTVTLPDGYPSHGPPSFEVSAPKLDSTMKTKLYRMLDAVYLENIGETVLYQWTERIREYLLSIKPTESKHNRPESQSVSVCLEKLDISDVKCPEIYHGEAIVDRKSTFQGHAAAVNNLAEVQTVLKKLKENKKIANAFHNMYAYRIERNVDGRKTMIQDCNDDGEAHAGGRLAHLLDILDQKNCLVVVSRWYGGIQLGPDRFRHINNAARNVLVVAGLVNK